MKKGVSARSLFYLSLAYVSFPCMLFFMGFLRWYWALAFIGIMLTGMGFALKDVARFSNRKNYEEVGVASVLSSRQILLVLIVVLGWMLFSGVGGYGHQDQDWLKHNAIIYDLIQSPGPVSYTFPQELLESASSSENSRFPLVYYIAYYLPAVFVGKLAGWFWAHQALFLWTYFGVSLSACWFLLLTGRATFRILLIFVMFSGLDSVGMMVLRTLLNQPILLFDWNHIEFWAVNWQYSSHTSLLFWVPNQAISGWLSGSMLLWLFRSSTFKKSMVLYFSLTLLWSPFVALGLSPFVMADFSLNPKKLVKTLLAYLSIPNFCGLATIFLFSSFFLAKFSKLPIPLPSIQKGLIFLSPRLSELFWYETLALLALFLLLEVGIYALFVCVAGKKLLNHTEWKVFFWMLGFLTLLPFFRYGYWNDLVMRASIPALFILAIFTVRTFSRLSWKNAASFILVMVFLLGAITPLVEFKRHVKGIRRLGTLFKLRETQSLYQVGSPVNPSFFLQYIGTEETPFFSVMSKNLDSPISASLPGGPSL